MIENPRLYAPAAARNREPIFNVLRRHLPRRGRVLEIASGSGEHVTFFASASDPELIFQPSDPDPAARASIDAWTSQLALPNVRPAVTLDAASADRGPELLGRLSLRDREDHLGASRTLVQGILPGYDFTREIELTDALALGDTVLLREGGEVVGFALCHTVPLVEGRVREELRVLKLVLADERLLDPMVRSLCDFAKRSGTRRVAFRVQGDYDKLYRRLITLGARVRWTDLRMSLAGRAESRPEQGVVLSNWEI